MTFGYNLLTLRKNKKLTQEELGRLIGATKQMVSNWERGENRPRQEYIDKLLLVFGIKASDLFKEIDEKGTYEGKLSGSPSAEEGAVPYSIYQAHIDDKNEIIRLLKEQLIAREKQKD